MNIISKLNIRKRWIAILSWASRYGLAAFALLISIISLAISAERGCGAEKLTREEKRSSALVEAWRLEEMLKTHYVTVSNRYYNDDIAETDLNRRADYIATLEIAIESIESIRKDLYEDKLTDGASELEALCGSLRAFLLVIPDKITKWERRYKGHSDQTNIIEQPLSPP